MFFQQSLSGRREKLENAICDVEVSGSVFLAQCRFVPVKSGEGRVLQRVEAIIIIPFSSAGHS